MAAGIIVCSILLATDQQFWVEELSVVPSTNLIDGRGIQVDEDRTRDIFAAPGFGEDCVEFSRVVKRFGIWIWATILLQTVLEKVSVITVLVSVQPEVMAQVLRW